MAAWGLLIEAGARIMAGHVEHLVPAWAAAFFRKAGN